MAATEEKVEPQESEDEKVSRWKKNQFLRLGFSLSMAVSLVEADADWHEAERVLARNPPGGHTWVYFYLLPQLYETQPPMS